MTFSRMTLSRIILFRMIMSGRRQWNDIIQNDTNYNVMMLPRIILFRMILNSNSVYYSDILAQLDSIE
jgi:hypothetical protein